MRLRGELSYIARDLFHLEFYTCGGIVAYVEPQGTGQGERRRVMSCRHDRAKDARVAVVTSSCCVGLERCGDTHDTKHTTFSSSDASMKHVAAFHWLPRFPKPCDVNNRLRSTNTMGNCLAFPVLYPILS